MPLKAFFLTAEQTLLFLAFFGVGLLLGKRKLLPESTGVSLSRLVLYVFLPAMSFLSFAQQCTPDKLKSYLLMIVAGTVLLLLSFPIGYLLQRRMQGDETDKLTAFYSAVLPNFGYIGYPLVLAFYGQQVLSKFMMFGLPFTVFAYAYILPKWMPAGQKQTRSEMIKSIFSPMLLCILLGIAWGLIGIPVPPVLENICTSASSCVSVCAMILTGLAIGRISLENAFGEKRAYVISAIRLLLLPIAFSVLTFFVCRHTGLDPSLLLIVGVFTALPLGMNPVIFCETYGRDGAFGADCAFISLLFCQITLPAMLAMQGLLFAML